MGRQLLAGFQVVKPNLSFQRQAMFDRVEHVKNHQVMPVEQKMVEARKDLIRVEEQITDQHDKPPPGHELGDLVEHTGRRRRRLTGTVHHRRQDLVELVGLGPRFEMGQNPVGEQRDADRVVLTEGKMSDGRPSIVAYRRLETPAVFVSIEPLISTTR